MSKRARLIRPCSFSVLVAILRTRPYLLLIRNRQPHPAADTGRFLELCLVAIAKCHVCRAAVRGCIPVFSRHRQRTQLTTYSALCRPPFFVLENRPRLRGGGPTKVTAPAQLPGSHPGSPPDAFRIGPAGVVHLNNDFKFGFLTKKSLG